MDELHGDHVLGMDEDEEAETEHEDFDLGSESRAVDPDTPMDLVDNDTPGTPVAPKFAPASPPTTGRTTRFSTRAVEDTAPIKAKKGTKRSPFDGWRRTKNGSESHGHKRTGDSLTAESAKRTRA
jgi:hypothetical protein